jgi:uncharacterized membrane protein YphA (DoxX/SURF4 family)
VAPSPDSDARRDILGLRAGLAFIWLATGLGVLHPYYREVGTEALSRLGLPSWPMVAACVLEVLLGLRVLLGRADTWLVPLQAALIVVFTVLLGVSQPALLADPFGVLTKNLPLLSMLATLWLLEREGWTPRALWILRVGMASIWFLDGLLPCLLVQSDELRRLLAGLNLPLGDPGRLLAVIGASQAVLAVLVLLLRGWPLRLLLLGQALGVLVITALVTRHNPLLWFHPFGPITKNVPIFLGTLIVLRRVSRPGGGRPG